MQRLLTREVRLSETGNLEKWQLTQYATADELGLSRNTIRMLVKANILAPVFAGRPRHGRPPKNSLPQMYEVTDYGCDLFFAEAEQGAQRRNLRAARTAKDWASAQRRGQERGAAQIDVPHPAEVERTRINQFDDDAYATWLEKLGSGPSEDTRHDDVVDVVIRLGPDEELRIAQ